MSGILSNEGGALTLIVALNRSVHLSKGMGDFTKAFDLVVRSDLLFTVGLCYSFIFRL